MKICCFRFDADTHACVSVGIPNLVALGDRLGARFTFFVNMGRAFDPGLTFIKAIRRLFTSEPRQSISAASKLGRWHALKAMLLNPRAGWSDPIVLKAAVRSGHEIGLHGGRNHARWENAAHKWSEVQLRREIEWGLSCMKRCELPSPISFASPAWNSPVNLPRVLRSFDFRILADSYAPFQEELRSLEGLCSFPTNIHPGRSSVGYLEVKWLQGCTTKQIIADFRQQLRTRPNLAVVYDHPFFAGIHALEQVDAMVKTAIDEGFRVTTIREAVHTLSAQSIPSV